MLSQYIDVKSIIVAGYRQSCKSLRYSMVNHIIHVMLLSTYYDTCIRLRGPGHIFPVAIKPVGLVCWSLTSLCHSNGHIETMPAREINPFTALTRIRSQFLRTQWSTSNHQRVDTTTPQTAEPSGLAIKPVGLQSVFIAKHYCFELMYFSL